MIGTVRLRLVVWLAVFVVGGVVFPAWWTKRAEAEAREYAREFAAEFTRALARHDAAVKAVEATFEEVDDLTTAQERRLRRYRNAHHVAAARRLGVGRVSSEAEIRRRVAAGELVPLRDTRYYRIQELDRSVAYVTPDVARLLEEIGERFHGELRDRGLPLYRYTVSSVLRTGADQRALRRVNPNAARGVSSHEYGTTLDIVYHKYDYQPVAGDALPPTSHPELNDRLETLRVRSYDALGMRHWQELQGILGRILIELQAEGKVLARLERQQPVFHITVADRLAE